MEPLRCYCHYLKPMPGVFLFSSHHSLIFMPSLQFPNNFTFSNLNPTLWKLVVDQEKKVWCSIWCDGEHWGSSDPYSKSFKEENNLTLPSVLLLSTQWFTAKHTTHCLHIHASELRKLQTPYILNYIYSSLSIHYKKLQMWLCDFVVFK